MATSYLSTTPEPEEQIELNLIAALRAALRASDFAVAVEGAHGAVEDGEVRTTDDTYVNVAANLSDSMGDFPNAAATPSDFDIKVALRVSFADDATGNLYADLRRALRAAFESYRGRACVSALSGDGITWHYFKVNSTSADIDTSDSETRAFYKVYNIAAKAVYQPTNAAQAE